MSQLKSFILGGLIALLMFGPAIAANRGVTPPASYIANIEIVQNDNGAPAGFAEVLREAVQRGAALYGADGQPVTLKIEVDKVHLKNPVASMLIGDNNRARGHVTAVDATTGQVLGTFSIDVDADRKGEALAMFIVGAIDPTGYVDIATTAASATSATVNRSDRKSVV